MAAAAAGTGWLYSVELQKSTHCNALMMIVAPALTKRLVFMATLLGKGEVKSRLGY
jgi:hypothetical protein